MSDSDDADTTSDPVAQPNCALDTLKPDEFETIFNEISLCSKEDENIKKECDDYYFFGDDHFDKIE